MTQIFKTAFFAALCTALTTGSAKAEWTSVIECASYGNQPNYCYTGLNYTSYIEVLEQYSHASCIAGQTFGGYGRGPAMWVGGGCRALFRIHGY